MRVADPHKLCWLLVLAVLSVATAAEAKDESCTDGVNCLCDTARQNDPGVVFCEDFESALLNQDGGGSGWTDAYGAPVDGCWQTGLPSGQWVKSVEGTCPTCCVNVVTETACEVPGQSDCVFQGRQSLGHRYRPGAPQGVVGTKAIQTGSNFGVTMAVKFSRNYANGPHPRKTNMFGWNHCVMGCSSGTYVSGSTGNPFHGVMFWDESKAAPTWRALIGRGGFSGVAFGWYPDVPGAYSFDRDHGLDSWHCWKLHIANPAKQGAKVRHWIDDKLLVHLEDVDLRGMKDAANAFNMILLNNYSNEGYPGTSTAYRYEDNIVVTTSTEPVTCEALGFQFGQTGPGALGTPGQPKLIP